MTSRRDDELLQLMADHFGILDPADSKDADAERLADLRELVVKINAAGLGPSSIRGLVNSEEIRKILGLGSIRSAWATMSRDSAFPDPIVSEKLWRASEVRKYALKRAGNRAGMPGRPPNSTQKNAGPAAGAAANSKRQTMQTMQTM